MSRPTGALKDASESAAHWVGSIRMPEFVLFFMIEGIGFFDIPDIGVPARHIVLGAIVVLGLMRNPRYRLGRYEFFLPVVAASVFYLGSVSAFAPFDPGAADWRNRLLRLVLVFLFIIVMATGRLDMRSGLLGYATALVVNVPAFYLGIVGGAYDGYLTGILGDKNVAGLAYATTGIALLLIFRSMPARFFVLAFFAVALWGTGSRTSLAAFASAVVWVALAPRLGMVGRWVLAGVVYALVEITAEDYSQVGVFSNRVGSDLLRARIDAASEAKVHQSGFLGEGLGEAYVHIQGQDWFFHNSYWSALVEGGWPWLAVLVGLTILILLRPFVSQVPGGQVVPQALGVILLVCAFRLGEVFGTTTWGLAMGIGMLTILRAGSLAEAGLSVEERDGRSGFAPSARRVGPAEEVGDG